LCDGCCVFPTHSGIECKSWANSPIVGYECIPERLPKVLIGVAKCDRACVGHSSQKVSEVGPSGASERECSSRIRLPEVIEFLPWEGNCIGDIVATAVHRAVIREAGCLVSVKATLCIRERCDADGKRKGWWAPVRRILTIAGNPCIGRDVHAVGEEWVR